MCGKSLFVLLYLFFWLLITSLVSFDYCIVCPSQIYDCWLPLWCLVAIVLSVLLRFTAADYPFGVLWPLCCLSFSDLRLLITPLVSYGHCVVCPSLYGCWLPLWCLVVIVLSVSVLFRFTAADYPIGVLWPLCCLSFALRLLITPLSVLLRFTAADYLFGILWPLCCLSFSALRLLITSLVSCGHCVVCPSSLYGCWLPLWYLVAIVLSVLLRFTAADYHCGVLWPLCCLFFFTLRLLITPLVSFDYCVVCPSSVYGFWLPFWCLLTIVLSVLLRFTAADYPFGVFKLVLHVY
jgi:hypothetical protein